jgi:hypothetical protein
MDTLSTASIPRDYAMGRDVALRSRVMLCALASCKLLIQFAGINHYGFFRDELYYMACGEHLAWGYVDQPPLVAFVAWLARHTLGTSLFATRLLPVLAGAAVVRHGPHCRGIGRRAVRAISRRGVYFIRAGVYRFR